MSEFLGDDTMYNWACCASSKTRDRKQMLGLAHIADGKFSKYTPYVNSVCGYRLFDKRSVEECNEDELVWVWIWPNERDMLTPDRVCPTCKEFEILLELQ